MTNPWLSIPAEEYDLHLSHPSVRQREFLDAEFASVLEEIKPRSIALLGCATGGGLDCVDPQVTRRITAVDLNPDYVQETQRRYSKRLPQLEVIRADLEDCELDPLAYELIHCALVFEYVDPAVVLERISRWLTADGVVVIVLQRESPKQQAVSNTGCESLKLLEPLMKLHEPKDIVEQAARFGLHQIMSTVEQLESGKEFYIGKFTRHRAGADQ